MAAPTTSALDGDVKDLREDVHKVEAALKESINDVKLDVRELSTQVKGLLTSIKLLAVLSISTLGASIWWGATLTADVRHLGSKIDERSRDIDERLDKLEASIVKAIDQAKAKAPAATNPSAD